MQRSARVFPKIKIRRGLRAGSTDHLRRSPAAATEYAAFKRELADRHRFDREAYTDAKAPFVRRVLEQAEADP